MVFVMMRLKLLCRMIEMRGATSHMMMKVGGATSHMMKVCGATKSTLSNVM